MDQFLLEVIRDMAIQALPQSDDTGLFRGSPRPFMEARGVSSGHRYRQLYKADIQLLRARVWIAPADFMP